MKSKLALLLLLSLFSSSALAKYKNHYRRHATVAIQKSTYRDVRLADGDDFIIQDTWDLELAYRFYRIFMVTLNGSVGDGSNSDRTDYGLGLRVGLPGFFFFGGRLDDITRRRMKHPVNTSLYFVNAVSTWKASSGSTQLRTSSYRFGFTADIFMFNPTSFFRLDLGIYNTRGNAHLNTSVGLGYEF